MMQLRQKLSKTAAVLLSALMIHNLNPGPKLFTEQPELVYGLFASMFAANLFMVIVGTGAGSCKDVKIPVQRNQPGRGC